MAGLDARAVKRVSGRAWNEIRPTFDYINQQLLAVSNEAAGELTTIYIKYTSPETQGRPYAVLWVKKSTELILGLCLPEGYRAPQLTGPPGDQKYTGLNGFIVFAVGSKVPPELSTWIKDAFAYAAVRVDSDPAV